MQGNDFVRSVMYRRGVTCFSCHDVHGTTNNADLIKPARDLCLTCHSPASPNGPHAPTLEAHTHHAAGSAGSDCVSCHMPQIEQEIANVNVRSHTFEFIPPTMTDELKVPNPCTGCHTDKSTQWAREALRGWANVSPWRAAN
jgi:predicted CXXCH cytochrome family protein